MQFGTVDAASLNGSVRSGNWTSLNIGSANASVYKKTAESKITLKADSISKTATLTYSGRFDVGELHIMLSALSFLFR